MISVAAPPIETPRVPELRHFASSPRLDEAQLRRAARREEAVRQGEELSRSRAQAYLKDFLERSEWGNRMNQFTVVWEAVPTMEELESYGQLDEAEGTRACRKLFNAVVVWDELGHSLWQRLKTTCEQKKAALKGLGPMLRMGQVGDEGKATEEPGRRHRSDSRNLSSSRMRACSQNSFRRLRSKKSMAALPPPPESKEIPQLPVRRSSGRKAAQGAGEVGGPASDLRQRSTPDPWPAYPRFFLQSCAFAVRKTLGVFEGSRGDESRGRRP